MRNSLLFTLVLLAGCQKHARNQRDLSDVWNKIKSKIANTWEAFKKLADKTKQRLQNYLQRMIKKIKIIGTNFENKIDYLKKDFRKIIENAISTGKNVKICLEDDKEVIEKLLTKILLNVTTCISSNINSLTKINISHDSFDFDDSSFLRSIEDKMTASLKTCENNDSQCLGTFQEQILNDLDIATWNVSQKALTVRNTFDDALETIMNCVTEGLTKATTSIVNESLQIILCVKNKQ
ncbi:unnamed protein product [Euphydryas editha]|uniref:Lipoprotein n=1 Tax=Euphydryas editha TaxID=104508 RepID=A0AAU9V0P5_EUPED|nr:unnamed protein product [Euphydryas editha]